MRTERLGDVARVIAGQSPPSDTYNTVGVGLPFFQGKADFGPKHPVARIWCSAPERIAERGDVLVSVRAPVGPSNVADVRSCIGRGLAAVRPSDALDAEYLALFIRANEGTLALHGQGSTFAAITRRDLEDLRISVPPLPEQKSRAAQLKAQLALADEALGATSYRRKTADLLRVQLYDFALAAHPPFALQPRASAPAGWAWHTLTDLARLESGHTPSRSRPDWWGGEVAWIALPDIRRVDGAVISETIESTNVDGIANSSARVLPTHTVVMSRTASVGFVTRMGRPMATSQDFVNWVCGPELDPEFLMHLLIRARSEIRALSSGAIHKTVYMPTLKSFRVCVPSITEQRRIAAQLRERLAEIDRMATDIDVQLNAIEALPRALLHRAFGAVA